MFSFCCDIINIEIYESDPTDSNTFLKTKSSSRNKYEQSRENIETTREVIPSLGFFFRIYIHIISSHVWMNIDNNKNLINVGKFYLHFVNNIVLQPWIVNKIMVSLENLKLFEQNKSWLEQSACTNSSYPSWPSRTLKFVQKFNRICYIRITEVLRYERAEQICEQHGLQLAIIDNIHLLEKLKEMQMCNERIDFDDYFEDIFYLVNTTCKGQCPQARGYYIGLKRQINENELLSKWIWSNNVTWTQNETDVSFECEIRLFFFFSLSVGMIILKPLLQMLVFSVTSDPMEKRFDFLMISILNFFFVFF
jgi:hypothetical protein